MNLFKFVLYRQAALVAISSVLSILLIVFVAHVTPSVSAATTTVTATVATSITCNTDNASTAFGTLSSASISTSTPDVTDTLSCNYGGGCALYVKDAGSGASPGLYAAAATGTPLIQSSTATLSAGTEGYGIQAASTTNGTGAALTIVSTYLKIGNLVGGLNITDTLLASSTAPSGSKEVVVKHKAAISGITKAGSYSDTITYSCVGN